MEHKVIKQPVPPDMLEILYERIPLLQDLLDDGTFLAGGVLRTLWSNSEQLSPEDTDIDLFFRDTERLIVCKKWIEVSGLYNKVFECPEGSLTTYISKQSGWKLQLISFDFYKDPGELISTFDFSVTMFGTDGVDLWYGKTSIEDVSNHRLRWNIITYPSSSLRRMMKYARKGYWMTESDYQEFVTKVWEHDWAISDKTLVYVD